MKVSTFLLAAAVETPNHPRWPLLVYERALEPGGGDLAAQFEALFARNGWPPAWRDGVFPFHHYHPDGHEALGLYSGEVTVQFGGDAGVTLTARPGDVIVLPAGTGHRKLGSRGRLGIVGAYPEARQPATLRAGHGPAERAVIAAVPRPALDPVCGPDGPLLAHWKA